MGENAEIFIEKANKSPTHESDENDNFSFFLTTVVWFGFLLLVFSLAFPNPPIYIKNQKLAATEFLFPVVFALWLICILLRQFKFRFLPASGFLLRGDAALDRFFSEFLAKHY